MGYRILGLHSTNGMTELIPYDEANYPLGNHGLFNSIEEAQNAYKNAHHFHAYPNPFPYIGKEGIQNPIESGFKLFICYAIM